MTWNGCRLSNIESVECPVYIIWSLMTESKWLWAVGHSKCGVSYLHNLFLNDRKQVIVSYWTLKVWIKRLLCMYWLSDQVFRSKLGDTLIPLSLPLSVSLLWKKSALQWPTKIRLPKWQNANLYCKMADFKCLVMVWFLWCILWDSSMLHGRLKDGNWQKLKSVASVCVWKWSMFF